MTEPIKTVKGEIWFFDIETVPCIETARKVYDRTPKDIGLGDSDADWMQLMYHEAGAILPLERVMVKTALQRVVAISALVRKPATIGVRLSMHSLPIDDDFDEKAMIEAFIGQIGSRRPQIVGFNHSGFDVAALFQRALIHGINLGSICDRPEKPWDPKPDYFNNKNDWNVDLMNVIGGWGKATPSLVEIARACGIPAKVGSDGSQVADLWLAGKRREIVDYCETDVLTTYLLWLRTARTSGLFLGESAFKEEEFLRQMLIDGRDEKPHYGEFLDAWDAMNERGKSATA